MKAFSIYVLVWVFFRCFNWYMRPIKCSYNLVSTWCKPPNSPPDLFNDFENLIGKIDGSNRELYLVGDMNTNLLPGVADSNSSKMFVRFLVLGN